MNETIACPGPVYRVPFRERLRVWWQNWKVRKTSRAYHQLRKALQEDKEYRNAWKANIACMIHDNVQAGPLGPENFIGGDMPWEQSNQIATRIMDQLF